MTGWSVVVDPAGRHGYLRRSQIELRYSPPMPLPEQAWDQIHFRSV